MQNKFIPAIKGYSRLSNFPLDASSVFLTKIAAEEYALTSPTAYAGQLVAVVNQEARNVIVYQLAFRESVDLEGFKLQSITETFDGKAFVTSVNGILPDEDGDIHISIEALDEILTFLEVTEDRIVFSKPISVSTGGISGDDDVITRSYLEATIDDILKGAVKTFKSGFTFEGGTTVKLIPNGATIQRAIIKITEAFEPCDITISLGGEVLFGPSEIYETEVGIYITEPFVTLQGQDIIRHPVIVTVSGSNTGAAELYIDFNTTFTR